MTTPTNLPIVHTPAAAGHGPRSEPGARRWLGAALCATVLAPALVIGCSAAKKTLAGAAIGTWACRSPAGSESPNWRVQVQKDGHFTFGFLAEQPNAQLTAVAKRGQLMSGTWKLTGTRVAVTVNVAKAVGTGAGHLQIDGASLDTSRVTLRALGVPAGEAPGSDIIVHRKGYDEATFQGAEPGAERFTCKKQ